jgi:hypothetical protein
MRAHLLVFSAASCALTPACAKACERDQPRAEPGVKPTHEDAGGQPRSDSQCPRFVTAGAVGRIENDELIEVSGLAASRKSPGVLWVHNDSGNPARLYALAVDGRDLAEFDVLGAGCVDWEDIAIGPGPAGGESYLYIADVGTNVTARDVIVIYRIPEPDVKPDQAPARGKIHGAAAFELVYPKGTSFDAETLMVDPQGGDLYLVTKSRKGPSEVYRAPAPLTPGRRTLEHVASLELGRWFVRGSRLATAGDISPDGTLVMIRTYTDAYLWVRTAGTSIAGALRTPPCNVPLALETQGEAIGFTPSGRGYYTVSEGLFSAVHFFERK